MYFGVNEHNEYNKHNKHDKHNDGAPEMLGLQKMRLFSVRSRSSRFCGSHPAPLAAVFTFGLVLAALAAPAAHAQFTVFEAAGESAAAITPTRDAFRAAIGGGTVAGADGSFGGLRREINWDGVPDSLSDPNSLPADFFNTTSPRGVTLSTPGTGFLVSANTGGASPVLFGFGSDFQTFSSQKLFTAVNSNITDISFFLPGTTTAATVSGFGVVFTDVEVAGDTRIQFFDSNNIQIFTRNALTAGNQGLTFLGAVSSTATASIARVRITSGSNTIVRSGVQGNPNDDVVAMDDFIYAEPVSVNATAAPEPGSLALLLPVMGAVGMVNRKRKTSK
jgi:hypothetical protein